MYINNASAVPLKTTAVSRTDQKGMPATITRKLRALESKYTAKTREEKNETIDMPVA